MLFCQSFFPSQRLSRYIARYLITSDNRKYRNWQRMEITPTGLSGLGFSLADNFRYRATKGNEQEISGGHIVGIHNCCYSLNWKYPFDFFVVIFKPAGASKLLKTNMNELRNDLVSLDMLGLEESEWICENLRNYPSHRDKVAFMESWLERKFAEDGSASSITADMARIIVERNGTVAIGDLCKEFKVNSRYLERHFLLELGTTPKEFAGIVRFNYLDNLLRQKSMSWSELVYLGNFHDQSHLNKHFLQLTGLSPRAFKHKLADTPPDVRFVNQHNVHGLVMQDEAISAAAR